MKLSRVQDQKCANVKIRGWKYASLCFWYKGDYPLQIYCSKIVKQTHRYVKIFDYLQQHICQKGLIFCHTSELYIMIMSLST
jgi:hypothetical protein